MWVQKKYGCSRKIIPVATIGKSRWEFGCFCPIDVRWSWLLQHGSFFASDRNVDRRLTVIMVYNVWKCICFADLRIGDGSFFIRNNFLMARGKCCSLPLSQLTWDAVSLHRSWFKGSTTLQLSSVNMVQEESHILPHYWSLKFSLFFTLCWCAGTRQNYSCTIPSGLSPCCNEWQLHSTVQRQYSTLQLFLKTMWVQDSIVIIQPYLFNLISQVYWC